MGNILKMMKKEVEKGNSMVSWQGETVTAEKVEATCKKYYLADLKDGSIPFDKSFADYQNEIMEKEYLPMSELIKIVEEAIGFETEEAELPQPQPQTK